MDSKPKQQDTHVPVTSGGGFFSSFRQTLWPIERHEYKKIIPMMIMMFLITFNYTVLRDLKDVLVLDDMGGSDPILFLKLFFVLPTSVCFMMAVGFLGQRVSKQQMFYILMSFFLGIFLVYGAILYPLRTYIEPRTGWAKATFNTSMPAAVYPLLEICENWTSAVMYVFSEMWGTVVLSLLFWGFANDICTVGETKRFYTTINLGANFSLILCGIILIAIGVGSENAAKNLSMEGNAAKYVSFLETKDMIKNGETIFKKFEIFMLVLILIVLLLGGVIMYTYNWMQRNVLTDPRLYDPSKVKPKKKKAKLGMFAALKLAFTSPYILCIACLVLMYGLSINFVEIYYKSFYDTYITVGLAGGKGLKTAWAGAGSMATGIVVIFLLTFVGSRSVRVIGWSKTALITPLIILSFGFPVILLATLNNFGVINSKLGATACALASFGMIAVAFSKSVKYSFFDPTKEMAYVPLDDDLKLNGKAAVDVVGARLGKSGSTFIQIILMFITASASELRKSLDDERHAKPYKSNIFSYAPYLLGLFFVCLAVWFFAVLNLGRRYKRLVESTTVAIPIEKQQPLNEKAALAGGEKAAPA